MNINVTKPEGDIFVIMGRFTNLTEQLEDAGIDTSEHRALLEGYGLLKYDEILDKIERITNGTMTFTGRQ